MDDFIVTIINSFLYVVTFIYVYSKHRTISVGVFLMFMYAMISLFCVINYNASSHFWHFSFFSFLYLYIVILIFMKPFMKNCFVIQENPLSSYNVYRTIAKVYIVLAIFSSIVYFPIALDSLRSSDLADIYEMAHEEKEGNLFSKFTNLFFHVRYLGMVLFFSFLAKEKQSKIFLFLLGIAAFLPVILATISLASRGGMVALFANFAIVFLMMKDILPKYVKRTLIIAVSIIIPLILIYFIAVTVSRFEESSLNIDAGESMMYYLGHSMLTFNYGVMDTIQNYANGAYMFDCSSLKDVRFGTHFGTNFITFVGVLYLDFGLVGTVLVAIIFCSYFCKIGRRRFLDIPDIYLLLTYSMLIFNGVFVLGRGYGIQLLEAWIIYFLLKFIQRATIGRMHLRA